MVVCLFVGVSVCGFWMLCYLIGCYLLCLLIVCFGLIGSFGWFSCWFVVQMVCF